MHDGDNGFVTPVGAIDAMAERVVRLLTDAELRRSMGARSVLKVQRFSLPAMVQALVDFYHTAVMDAA